ncbi:methyltransferase domain-containing protein [Psychromonas antarctica]|uniref:methyltransferase domain-containing protein n=1 Tax=Psychromonas antarctica TaxID=67573 RepID=UPI001EE81827|nr:methyltransferase domain-containing protein [Psychromonas antarctica]MCG6201300.1 methyltransferase domain-containing protein [Psychromonas antarctica]
MKICIVANNAYGALTGEESGHIGGVERQTALLSEWLSTHGHQVSVITWDEGGAPIEFINGIQIIKLCKISEGLPILRFFTPRWTSLIAALKKADADIYYHNCAEYITGQVSLWCRLNNKPFIYTVASDADCELELPNLKSKREEYLFRYGLTHANLVITQTKKQHLLLQNNYGINAQVINMPGTPPNPASDFNRRDLFSKQKVIWIGRLHKVKRIEWLIDIARKTPNVSYEVVGPADDQSDYMDDVLSQLKSTKNINYRGKISRQEMPAIYQNATILCCTSIYEGFPNTYLEAWSYGVPVISTIDPDNIIKDQRLGYHAVSQEDFISSINQLLKNNIQWEDTSIRCEQYYLQHHEQNQVMQKFESEFLGISFSKIKQHFDEQSDTWSGYYKDDALSVSHLDLQRRLNFCQNILASIPPPLGTPRLLDIGCGSGDSFSAIKDSANWAIDGVDISHEMVKEATQVYPDINVQIANATCLPFPDNTFQAVVSLGTLEYITDYKRALKEAYRVLTPQGNLIVSIPNKQSIFRRLRRLENIIMMPLKYLIAHKKDKKIFHQQWYQSTFIHDLQQNKFNIETIEYCTYAFLSPKLEKAITNIRMCQWLNEKLANQPMLNKFLANTIIIYARVK